MVKADVHRDYYADLGLTPSAESEDIKKQFRKLALKYHPDRNQGRELEFIAKFQAIQAANEILSDPQQRLKYDTDRLRAGYGKLYGPPKPNTARKTAPSNYPSTPTGKSPNAKQPFSARPQSFHGGPSTGAQRYASYARAAPKQPWEKVRDEGQTRADAYRGFQEMKGNSMPGWNQFDPRTGRSAYSGATPRPHATSAGQRPKSAYEYFKTSPKPATEAGRAQSTRKKQGFAPRAAGGDEPMASNTSSYSNIPRGERAQTNNHFFGSAPSPTARKAAAGFQNRAETPSTPEFERTSSKYASTGGEKTYFSSTGFARSSSVRESPESPKPYPRTNPPSPTPPDPGRHRSASPKLKTDRNRNYSSTSSSDDEYENTYPTQKPKAVPKSRLHPYQKYSPHQKYPDLHAQQQGGSATEGHDSGNAASPASIFGTNGQEPFGSTEASRPSGAHQTEAFKSSSHDELRKPFIANNWGGSDFFKPNLSDKDQPQSTTRPSSRGRAARRNGQSGTGNSAGMPTHDSLRSGSSSQQYTPFAKASFHAHGWAEKLRDMPWVMLTEDGSKKEHSAANVQRPRSPRKQNNRPGAKVRSTPQPASVSTEAEEGKPTVDGAPKPKSAKTRLDDGEAMDLDDDPPANGTHAGTEPKNAADTLKENPEPKHGPASSGPSKEEAEDSKSRLFDLKNLRNTAPFTPSSTGGIEDLQDIYATLPFESRARASRTTMTDIRPRELNCPNPPKRPEPPQLVPVSVGSQQVGLQRAAWGRYVLEMNTYMQEWNTFNHRILNHFNARQEAIKTGMAPNWISAVGDSTRIKVDDQSEQEGRRDAKDDDDDENDDRIVAGSGKGGYSAYLRGLEEDAKVLKHWEVARELHRECILKLGQTREWILDGGRLI